MPVVPLTKLFFIVDYMEIIYSLCSCNTMIFIAGYSIYQFVWEKKKLKYYFQNLQFHNEYSFILPLEHNKSKNFTTAASLLIKIRAHRISSTVQPVDRNSKGTNFISNRA